ncbi:MAG: hypothetical protein ABIQ93_14000, partial [Saprospiraceae bacterium]
MHWKIKTIALLALLALTGGLAAQAQSVQALEERLVSASGPARAGILISLSEACYQAGQWGEAADWAEEAEELCKKIKQPALRALAFNRLGKAQLAGGKRKAGSKFEQSQDLLRTLGLPDKALMLDNLNNLHRIALAAGRDKDLLDIEMQIARLQGVPLAPAPVPSTELPGIKQELNALRTQVNAATTMQEQQLALLEQSKELQAQLAQKEAAINQMTDDQMKSAMLLM